MMENLTYMLVLGLVACATGRRISTTCVDLCKVESSIKCEQPCDLESSILSSLSMQYGADVINSCVTPCRCDKHEFVYPVDKICQIIQSFVAKNAGKDCKCTQGANVWTNYLAKWNIQETSSFARKDVIDYLLKRELSQRRLRTRAEEPTVNPWENWCKHQCAEGLGGSACYCDIIP